MKILDVIARHAGWEGAMLHKTTEICRLSNGLFVRDLVDRFEEKVHNKETQSNGSFSCIKKVILNSVFFIERSIGG